MLVSRVHNEQQIDMGSFVESPELCLRVPKPNFLSPTDFQTALERLEAQSRELEAAQVETMGDLSGKKPLPAKNPAS